MRNLSYSYINLTNCERKRKVFSKLILSGIKKKIINEKTFIIIASLVVGILSGLASVVLKSTYVNAIAGGLVLCALIFVIPPFFGEGYETVTELLVLNIKDMFANGVYSKSKQNIYPVVDDKNKLVGIINLDDFR